MSRMQTLLFAVAAAVLLGVSCVSAGSGSQDFGGRSMDFPLPDIRKEVLLHGLTSTLHSLEYLLKKGGNPSGSLAHAQPAGSSPHAFMESQLTSLNHNIMSLKKNLMSKGRHVNQLLHNSSKRALNLGLVRRDIMNLNDAPLQKHYNHARHSVSQLVIGLRKMKSAFSSIDSLVGTLNEDVQKLKSNPILAAVLRDQAQGFHESADPYHRPRPNYQQDGMPFVYSLLETAKDKVQKIEQNIDAVHTTAEALKKVAEPVYSSPRSIMRLNRKINKLIERRAKTLEKMKEIKAKGFEKLLELGSKNKEVMSQFRDEFVQAKQMEKERLKAKEEAVREQEIQRAHEYAAKQALVMADDNSLLKLGSQYMMMMEQDARMDLPSSLLETGADAEDMADTSDFPAMAYPAGMAMPMGMPAMGMPAMGMPAMGMPGMAMPGMMPMASGDQLEKLQDRAEAEADARERQKDMLEKLQDAKDKLMEKKEKQKDFLEKQKDMLEKQKDFLDKQKEIQERMGEKRGSVGSQLQVPSPVKAPQANMSQKANVVGKATGKTQKKSTKNGQNKAQSKSQSKAQSKAQSKSQSKAQSKSQSKAQSKSQGKAAKKAESKGSSKPDTNSVSKSSQKQSSGTNVVGTADVAKGKGKGKVAKKKEGYTTTGALDDLFNETLHDAGLDTMKEAREMMSISVISHPGESLIPADDSITLSGTPDEMVRKIDSQVITAITGIKLLQAIIATDKVNLKEATLKSRQIAAVVAEKKAIEQANLDRWKFTRGSDLAQMWLERQGQLEELKVQAELTRISGEEQASYTKTKQMENFLKVQPTTPKKKGDTREEIEDRNRLAARASLSLLEGITDPPPSYY